MIVSGFLALLKVILGVLLVLLPQYTPPQGVGLSVLAAADFILPLSELGLVMGAVVAYATASLGYAGIMRVINVIRGSG